MPRTCSAENCSRPIFSHSFCSYHQYLRKRFGGDLYKENKANKPRSRSEGKIPRRTKDRASDERYYAVQAKEFFDEAVINKTNRCFFCGERVNTFQGLHHLRGRVGKYLLDKLWWVIVHNKCHVDNYHQANAEQRMAQPWWQSFLLRMRAKGEDLYVKELKKIDKAGLLFDEDLDY
jgi:hypothetical protein